MDDLDIDLESAETAASRDLARHITSDSSLSSGSDASEIARYATQRESIRSAHLQHVRTVGSTRTGSTADSKPFPAFGAHKPYPPEIPAEREAYVVDFDGPADPLHPLNWPGKQK